MPKLEIPFSPLTYSGRQLWGELRSSVSVEYLVLVYLRHKTRHWLNDVNSAYLRCSEPIRTLYDLPTRPCSVQARLHHSRRRAWSSHPDRTTNVRVFTHCVLVLPVQTPCSVPKNSCNFRISFVFVTAKHQIVTYVTNKLLQNTLTRGAKFLIKCHHDCQSSPRVLPAGISKSLRIYPFKSRACTPWRNHEQRDVNIYTWSCHKAFY